VPAPRNATTGCAAAGRGNPLDDLSLLAEALSLRFNQEGFCDGLYSTQNPSRSPSSPPQAAVLMAG
jgi:hypothetical protein